MKIKKQANTVRVPPLKKAIKVKRKSSDIEEESTVSKAIENVKKIFEKRNVKHVKKCKTTADVSPKLKDEDFVRVTKSKKKRPNMKRKDRRGIVYLGHIPHGFYEEQITDYFKQFGRIQRVRVARSRKTGKSRGYGYVEFIHPEVAKIAAESMNNYLMCGRLLKATYIAPEKQHSRYFAGRSWSEDTYPKLRNRTRLNKVLNACVSKQKHNSSVQSMMDKLSNLEKKLNEKGIQIQFTPVSNAQ